jgi:adenine nucleotide transporter 17
MNVKIEPVDHAVAGSFSSVLVFAALYPLDVARTRQQSTQANTLSSNVGVLRSLQQLYQQEGLPGLYSGLHANLVSIGTSQCLYFFFYELLKDVASSFILQDTRPNSRRPSSSPSSRLSSLFQDLIVAFVAGTINATVTCPMWVAATRLKLSSSNDPTVAPPTFAQALVDVVSSGDAWRGLGPSLILCTNPALQYGIYEQLKGTVLRAWAKRGPPGRVAGEILNPMPAFVIGAISKSIATVAT